MNTTNEDKAKKRSIAQKACEKLEEDFWSNYQRLKEHFQGQEPEKEQLKFAKTE